jgi:hypothetical protein
MNLRLSFIHTVSQNDVFGVAEFLQDENVNTNAEAIRISFDFMLILLCSTKIDLMMKNRYGMLFD